MGELKKPLFLIAAALCLAVCLTELGAGLALGPGAGSPRTGTLEQAMGQLLPGGASVSVQQLVAHRQAERPPGFGIPYAALLDGLVLWTLLLMGAPLLLPERLLARVQGVATFVVALLALLGSLLLLVLAFSLLLVMVALFLSAPFGTLAYLAVWGFFDRQGAAIVLSLVMVLKLVGAGFLVASQPRFLQNKGLVLILLTTLLATALTTFLHGFVPGILVSIADAVSGIVIAVLALLWALGLLIGALPAIFKAVRVLKPSTA